MKGIKSVNILQYLNHHYKWNIILQLKTETKNDFEKKTVYCFYFSVASLVFSINSSTILTPKRVLKNDYEIVKEAVFEGKANNKQQTRLLYICCRHKSLLTNSGMQEMRLTPSWCFSNWALFCAKVWTEHRASILKHQHTELTVKLHCPCLPGPVSSSGSSLRLLSCSWGTDMCVWSHLPDLPHRHSHPGASPSRWCSGGHGPAPCSSQTCTQSNHERVCQTYLIS